ncbi:MAG: sporulation protein [Hyphomicrobiales bacterium]
MGFFGKMMASVGVGNMKVDTQLESEFLTAGSEASGVVLIKGGDVEQTYNRIELLLQTDYYVTIAEEDDEAEEESETTERRVVTLERLIVDGKNTIQAGEIREIPFQIRVPLGTPIHGLTSREVWLTTDVDISFAIDPSDEDIVKVQPDIISEMILNSFGALGFHIDEIDAEEVPQYMQTLLPFVEELELKAHEGPFYRKVDEVEVILTYMHDRIRVWLEIDKRGGFFTELLDIDEVNCYIDFPYDCDLNQEVCTRFIYESIAQRI